MKSTCVTPGKLVDNVFNSNVTVVSWVSAHSTPTYIDREVWCQQVNKVRLSDTNYDDGIYSLRSVCMYRVVDKEGGLEPPNPPPPLAMPLIGNGGMVIKQAPYRSHHCSFSLHACVQIYTSLSLSPDAYGCWYCTLWNRSHPSRRHLPNLPGLLKWNLMDRTQSRRQRLCLDLHMNMDSPSQ